MGGFFSAVATVAPLCACTTAFSPRATGNQLRRRAARTSGLTPRSGLKSVPGNRVLMVGKIRELALYRAEVLRAPGFSVAIPEDKAEAAATIRRGGFDVAVLTYTLSSDTVEELTELLRQHCPECRLVTISETKLKDPKINPDANVLADDGPKALIDALRETLKRG